MEKLLVIFLIATSTYNAFGQQVQNDNNRLPPRGLSSSVTTTRVITVPAAPTGTTPTPFTNTRAITVAAAPTGTTPTPFTPTRTITFPAALTGSTPTRPITIPAAPTGTTPTPFTTTTGAAAGSTITTPLAKFRQCIRTCPTTPEYNPVCGTDNVTYENPGRLLCAQSCGLNVTVLRAESRCTISTT